jgi:holo-[acyl-carrier protein] synthase
MIQTPFKIGTDIIEIKKFKNLEYDYNNKFLQKIFTKNELKYCFSKSKPEQHLAVRFAGKESIIKALSESNEKINFIEIEIMNNEYGAPNIKLHNAKFKNFEIKISLSHSNDNAIAFAIVYKI